MARKKQRRPSGVRWKCDEAFLERLSLLLGSKTAQEVADEVGEAMRYEIDDSMIRKLRTGATPSSSLVGPICRYYGWPVPPLADADPELGQNAASIYELRALDPERYERVRRYIAAELEAARIKRDFEASEKDD